MNPSGLAAASVAAILVAGAIGLALREDARQRALLEAGQCTSVMEALFTPSPVAHSTCNGEGALHYCTTWFSQPAPYLRTLWRCTDPDKGDGEVEFWRRSADGGGW